MHLSVYEQGEIFRFAFLFGLLLGVLYDLFRLLRAMGFDSRSAVFFQDVAFMACSAVLCFMFAQTTVHGRFRMFIMAGHLLGFAAYRVTLGIVTGRVYSLLGRAFKWAARALNGMLVKFADMTLRLSANISRKVHNLHSSEPICENIENFFDQI